MQKLTYDDFKEHWLTNGQSSTPLTHSKQEDTQNSSCTYSKQENPFTANAEQQFNNPYRVKVTVYELLVY